jgi:hypothetical protein
MPKLVTYAADIPSKDCGACHKKVADLFVTNTSKHKPLECAFCHKEKHRMVPACQDCQDFTPPASCDSRNAGGATTLPRSEQLD